MACTPDEQPADADVVAYERAVELEHGVPVIVADLSAIAPNVVPEIHRTPDRELGTWRILGRTDRPGVPLVVVEIHTPDDAADVPRDRQLTDGRWIGVDDRPSARTVSFVTADDRPVFVRARDLDVDINDLVGLVEELDLSGDAVTSVPDEWALIGTVPIPGYLDGFTATYPLDDDFEERVTLRVERRRGDRMLLAEFGPSRPVDLGFDGAALQWIASDTVVAGYIFEYTDDLIVEITGDIDDDEFRTIISTLREAEPAEFEIGEPQLEL